MRAIALVVDGREIEKYEAMAMNTSDIPSMEEELIFKLEDLSAYMVVEGTIIANIGGVEYYLKYDKEIEDKFFNYLEGNGE